MHQSRKTKNIRATHVIQPDPTTIVGVKSLDPTAGVLGDPRAVPSTSSRPSRPSAAICQHRQVEPSFEWGTPQIIDMLPSGKHTKSY